DVRTVHLADHQHADGSVRVVAETVRAALAARERVDLALGQLLPAVGAAQAEPPLEDDQQLLAGDMVVEDHLVTRAELVDARTEELGAGVGRDPDGADAVGGLFSRIAQVAQASSASSSSSSASRCARIVFWSASFEITVE